MLRLAAPDAAALEVPQPEAARPAAGASREPLVLVALAALAAQLLAWRTRRGAYLAAAGPAWEAPAPLDARKAAALANHRPSARQARAVAAEKSDGAALAPKVREHQVLLPLQKLEAQLDEAASRAVEMEVARAPAELARRSAGSAPGPRWGSVSERRAEPG